MRTRVFIDGHALHRDAAAAGYTVDFSRLRGFYRPEIDDTVTLEFYNIEMIRADGTSTLRKLLDWLELNGWRCRVVEVDLDEKNSVRDARPELMVWMGVDILAAAERADRIVIWSGDRALKAAITAAQAKGVSIEVVADLGNCPTSLRRLADVFTEIGTMRPLIEKLEKATA